MEFLLGLLCFAVTLAAVAGVGHALWLLASAAFSALFGSPRIESHPCVGCGESYSPFKARCPWCGLDPDSKTANELRDLEAAARTVQRMLEQGDLPDDACEM